MIDLPYSHYKIGDYLINCQELSISNGKDTIKLPVKVFQLLKLFIAQDGHSVLRSQAIELIWSGNEGVGKRGFTNAMWHLRKTFTDLGSQNDEVFKTLRKVGYILVLPPVPIQPNLSTTDGITQNKVTNVGYQKFILLSAIMLLFSLGSIFYVVDFLTKEKETQNTQLNLEPDTITNFEGIEDHPKVSHDGQYLAFRWRQDTGNSQIYVKNLKQTDSPLRLITSNTKMNGAPVWSPDDHAIAYLESDEHQNCQIVMIELLTNEKTTLVNDCRFDTSRANLDWSQDGNYLLYSKAIGQGQALFKYDFASKTSQQMSFPSKSEKDAIAIFSKTGKEIAFIRQTYSQASLILLDEQGNEKPILKNKLSIVGLSWNFSAQELFVSVLEGSHYQLQKYKLASDEWQMISRLNSPSNSSFNQKTGELFYSSYSSKEYIVHRKNNNDKQFRKVSSSSRDMYGSYIPENQGIVFVSNRSKSWDVWVKTSKGTKNLTKGIGNAFTPKVSPNSQFYVVNIKLKSTGRLQLFIGNFDSEELIKINTPDLIPSDPAWSLDGKSILFAGQNDANSGIYKYTIQNKTLKQLTFGGEAAVIEGKGNSIYVTKKMTDGLWQINLDTAQETLITKDLSEKDFGSFYLQADELYYLNRSDKADRVMKYKDNTVDEVIATLPLNSIRSYYGLSPAGEDGFLLTLNSIHDADILSIKP